VRSQPESAPVKPSILVVDDDPAIRSSLVFSLQVEGFAVRAYPDGAALLQEFPFAKAGCLIVDYNLPGMNGLDLVSELRDREIEVPAILITSLPSSGVRERAAAVGAVIVEKPLLGETLFQEIRSALRV